MYRPHLIKISDSSATWGIYCSEYDEIIINRVCVSRVLAKVLTWRSNSGKSKFGKTQIVILRYGWFEPFQNMVEHCREISYVASMFALQLDAAQFRTSLIVAWRFAKWFYQPSWILGRGHFRKHSRTHIVPLLVQILITFQLILIRLHVAKKV